MNKSLECDILCIDFTDLIEVTANLYTYIWDQLVDINKREEKGGKWSQR